MVDMYKSWETRRKNGWTVSPESRQKMSDSAKRRRGTTIQRFWKQVLKVEDGCWLWTGAADNSGYGQIVTNGVSTKAHRFSWELHNGDIPRGKLVCHHCDITRCVNPLHLFIGTTKDNSQDSVNKLRHAYGEKHGVAKLTEKEAIEILQWNRSLGESIPEMARRLRVSVPTVEAIRSGRTWRYLYYKYHSKFYIE